MKGQWNIWKYIPVRLASERFPKTKMQQYLYIYYLNTVRWHNHAVPCIMIEHAKLQSKRHNIKSHVDLSKDTPYLTLRGVLWGVQCKDFIGNWPRHNGLALYVRTWKYSVLVFITWNNEALKYEIYRRSAPVPSGGGRPLPDVDNRLLSSIFSPPSQKSTGRNCGKMTFRTFASSSTELRQDGSFEADRKHFKLGACSELRS